MSGALFLRKRGAFVCSAFFTLSPKILSGFAVQTLGVRLNAAILALDLWFRGRLLHGRGLNRVGLSLRSLRRYLGRRRPSLLRKSRGGKQHPRDSAKLSNAVRIHGYSLLLAGLLEMWPFDFFTVASGQPQKVRASS